MKYKVELSAFEGPLDLLLHLIKEAEIDIYDIPIKEITEEFSHYLDKMQELNLEVTSDFLVMASTLIEIKSKMLLPVEKEMEEEEEVDPRKELVERLIEYKKYKEVSESLRQMENIQSKVYYKPKEDIFDAIEEIELESLDISVLVKSLKKILDEKSVEEKNIMIDEIEREEITLSECIKNIEDTLKEVKSFYFTSLVKKYSTIEEIITYFLAILELTKIKTIRLKQKEDFSDILIISREDGNIGIE